MKGTGIGTTARYAPRYGHGAQAETGNRGFLTGSSALTSSSHSYAPAGGGRAGALIRNCWPAQAGTRPTTTQNLRLNPLRFVNGCANAGRGSLATAQCLPPQPQRAVKNGRSRSAGLVDGIQRDEVFILRIRAEGMVLGLIAVCVAARIADSEHFRLNIRADLLGVICDI